MPYLCLVQSGLQFEKFLANSIDMVKEKFSIGMFSKGWSHWGQYLTIYVDQKMVLLYISLCS
jgi:hypothetical protein